MKKLLLIAIVALGLGSCKKEAQVKPSQPSGPNCNCRTITRVDNPYVVSLFPTVWAQEVYFSNDCTGDGSRVALPLANYKVGDKKCN